MTGRQSMICMGLACLGLVLVSPAYAAPPFCGDGKCNGGETEAECPADCGGGGGGGWLSTCDTLRDDPADGLFSDGEGVMAGNDSPGEYCDSERQVEVGTGVHGGHLLDTEKSSRELHLDLGNCISGPCTLPTGWSGSVEAVLSLDNNDVHLIDMPVGETYAGLSVGWKSGRKNHVRLSFGRLNSTTACATAGEKVLVDKLDASTWTFESMAGDRACLSEIVNNDWDNPVEHGYYSVPFFLTVRAQQ